MSVIVDDKDPLNCPAHAKVFIVFLQPLEACRDGRILFGLRLFRAEGEVGHKNVKDDLCGMVESVDTQRKMRARLTHLELGELEATKEASVTIYEGRNR